MTEDIRPDKLEVSVGDKAAWARVRGRAKFPLAPALRRFAERVLTPARPVFCLDLQACASLDSTFVGTLVLIATEIAPPPREVHVLNATEDVRRQLADLGVSGLFRFGGAGATTAPGPAFQRVAARPQPDENETRATMLHAHEALADLSPENERSFRDVIAFLKSA